MEHEMTQWTVLANTVATTHIIYPITNLFIIYTVAHIVIYARREMGMS